MEASELEVLSAETCEALLRATVIGRIVVVVDGFPVVMPVNYRLVTNDDGRFVIVIRTRPGNVIDHPPSQVGFQIDGIDTAQRTGWSVLVRARMRRVSGEEWEGTPGDPEPLLVGRDAWLALDPVSISGRRLRSAPSEWAFHIRGYL